MLFLQLECLVGTDLCHELFKSGCVPLSCFMYSALPSHTYHLAHLLRLLFVCAGDESCSFLYDDREVKYCSGKLKEPLPS